MVVSRALYHTCPTNPEESFTADDEPEISQIYTGLKVHSNAFLTDFLEAANLSFKKIAIETRQLQYYQNSKNYYHIFYTTKK
jgi:hypothetical protein